MNPIRDMPEVYFVAYYDAPSDVTDINRASVTTNIDIAKNKCREYSLNAEDGNKHWVVDGTGRCCSEVFYGDKEW